MAVSLDRKLPTIDEFEQRLFTIAEFEQMIDAGILTDEDRVELLYGRIINMAAIYLAHATCVARLDLFFHERLGRAAYIWVQNPLHLPFNSRPEPDVTLLKWRDDLYAEKFPTHEDVLLLIEVADATLKKDMGTKAKLYAQSGIPHYWVVNLTDQVVEVFSDPKNGKYESVTRAGQGDGLNLPAPLSGTIHTKEVLG